MAEFDIRQVGKGGSLADAHAVRRAVFVDEQGVPEPIEMDGNDEAADHLVAYEGDQPVGTGRLRVVAPGVAKIERLAVRKQWRGRRLGRNLLSELEDLARDAGLDEAHLHAQTATTDFYRSAGYTPVGDTFEEAGIPHVEMQKHLVRDSWTC